MKVFWIDTADNLINIHPYDPHGDGSGQDPLEDGDLFFVGNIDHFLIYRFAALDAFEIDRPPHNYIADNPYDAGKYVSFSKVNISLSLTGMDWESGSTGDGTYDQATYPLACEFADTLFTKRQVVYFMGNQTSTYLSAGVTFNINTSTQADWDEWVGNTDDIIWTATGIEPGQTLAYSPTNLEYTTGGQYVDAAPYTRQNGKYLPARLSDLYFVGGLYSGTDPYTFYLRLYSYDDNTYQSITTEATFTLTRDNDGTSGYAGLEDVCKITGEYAAFGVSRYTGSKPEQGAVEVVKINSDWTLTSEAIVDAPAPARYGQFGLYACFMTVTNDATYGTDLQMAVIEPGTESIYIFSQSRSWALHQTITFGRDDILMWLDGWGDYFVHWYRADGSSNDYAKGYTYNGTVWSEVCNQLIGTTETPLLAFPNQTWSYNNSTTNYVYLYDYNGGTYLRRFPHNDYADSAWMGPGPYLMIYDVNPDQGALYECGSSDMVFEKTWYGITENSGGIYNDTDEAMAVISRSGYSRPYFPQVISTYVVGTYIIESANDNARWTVDAGNNPNTGSFSETLLAATSVWVAFSLDEGVTWKFWNQVTDEIETCVDPYSSTTPTNQEMTPAAYIYEIVYAMPAFEPEDYKLHWLIRMDATSADIPQGEITGFTLSQWELSNRTFELRTNYLSDHYLLSAVVDPDYAVYVNMYDTSNPYNHLNIAYFDDLT